VRSRIVTEQSGAEKARANKTRNLDGTAVNVALRPQYDSEGRRNDGSMNSAERRPVRNRKDQASPGPSQKRGSPCTIAIGTQSQAIWSLWQE